MAGGHNFAQIPGGQNGAYIPGGQNGTHLLGGQNGVHLPGGQNVSYIPGGQNGDLDNPGPPRSADEDDTYTTFVFTKSPVMQRHSRDLNNCEEFRKHGVTFGSVPPPHINGTESQCPPQDQHEESVYVKMYPPKTWQQNQQQNGVKHPPPPPLPPATQQKSQKQVGFSDLVNKDNLRGIPEGRLTKDNNNSPLCQSSPKKIPDLSEIDTHGYMSLCHVKRAPEENHYASIEPLNGSYLNDNASEISEFTYSKHLSRASQSLYPHLKNTPLSSRKLLHLQQKQLQNKQNVQQKLQNLQQNQQQNPAQHHHRQLFRNPQLPNASPQRQRQSRSVSPDRKPRYNQNRVSGQNATSSPSPDSRKPKFACQDRIPEYSSTAEIHQELNRKFIAGQEAKLRSQSSDALLINKDVHWPENNIHNDSGIGDHDSSPKSDGELSDRGGMKFDYKPVATAPYYTPTLQRRTTNNNKVTDGGGGNPNVIKVTDIQVHDVPRWVREDKSRIVCANDSCVEDNDARGGLHVAHTPSCPYHVCNSCNGIVPEHAMKCSDPSQQCTNHNRSIQCGGTTNAVHCTEQQSVPNGNQAKQCVDTALHNGNHGNLCMNDQQSHNKQSHNPYITMHNTNVPQPSCSNPNSRYPNNHSLLAQQHFPSNGNQVTSQTPYSDDGDCESEDDFGYMSMEKFNIYKETVMKHHRGKPLTCKDHETATKIYFL